MKIDKLQKKWMHLNLIIEEFARYEQVKVHTIKSGLIKIAFVNWDCPIKHGLRAAPHSSLSVSMIPYKKWPIVRNLKCGLKIIWANYNLS